MRKGTKRKIGIFAMFTIVVMILGVALAGCGGKTVIDDNKVLTQGDFQKEPTSKYLSDQGLKGELEAIKVGNGKGEAALAAFQAAERNMVKVKEYAWFVVTNTNIKVDLEKSQMGGKTFNVQQRSTYAVVTDSKGQYTQTVSGMRDLIVGGMNLSSIASSFGYVNRSYETATHNYSTAGSGPNFKDTAKLAGATAKWKKTEGGPKKPPAPVDPNAPKKDKYNQNDPFYSKNAAYIWDESALGTGGELDTGAWMEYVQDYNYGKGNGTGGKYANKSKKLPSGGAGYQTDKRTLDMKKSTIVKNGKFFEVKLYYNEKETDYACRYAKSALVRDINQFVAPWDMKYIELEQTYQIWSSGLVKSVARSEKFLTEADAIIVGKGAGSAHNTADTVYSYSIKDYDTEKYTNPKAWKDRTSVD